MPKKLTYRQQQFLGQFVELYLEQRQPLHYVTIAERLGVAKVTAYEMLRLLEEHGLVRAEYQASPEKHGPGRPAVLFYPTRAAGSLLSNPPGSAPANPLSLEDWQRAKDQILQKLRESQAAGYEELLSNLLARLPERRSPLILVTELITSMVLCLAAIQDAPEIKAIMSRLRRIGLPQEISLNVFSGLGMLLSVWERTNRASSAILVTQINRYEEALSQLSEESRRQLAEFTREVVQILSSDFGTQKSI